MPRGDRVFQLKITYPRNAKCISYVINLNQTQTSCLIRFNAHFICLVISNLKVLPISSLLWKRQDVSVGEEDSYVTAGYDPHKGERRLLPLPTLLIHLIIRPSGWLKAGCMATWHAVTPTLLSDERLCPLLSNCKLLREFQKNGEEKKSQPHLSQIAYNSDWHFEARPRPLWRPRWGWCNLWNSSVLRSAPFARTIRMSCYIHLNEMF